MEKYTRDFEKEFDLINELVDDFDFDYVPVINEALSQCGGYDYLADIESPQDIKVMRKNVRKQLKNCLDELAKRHYIVTYIDDAGTEHSYYKASIRGQFETEVTYYPEDGTYGGEIKYIGLESATY